VSWLRFEPRPYCAWVQHANHSATEPQSEQSGTNRDVWADRYWPDGWRAWVRRAPRQILGSCTSAGRRDMHGSFHSPVLGRVLQPADEPVHAHRQHRPSADKLQMGVTCPIDTKKSTAPCFVVYQSCAEWNAYKCEHFWMHCTLHLTECLTARSSKSTQGTWQRD